MIESNSVLSTHRFDYSKEGGHQNNNTRGKDKDNETTESNNNDERPTLFFAQLEGKCYCCGKAGHKSPDCYKKNKTLREEWAINKTQMANVVQE